MCSKDDCGKTKTKDSYNTRRSKQNTYHVVNKNIAPSKITDGLKTKDGMPSRGIPKLRLDGVLEFGLGCMGIPKLRFLPLFIPLSIRTSPKT
jgi:hypothetical protein